MPKNEYINVAISDIGTQLFWYNPVSKLFEYALPVTAGAEFGGDSESIDVTETDLDKNVKLFGRETLNNVVYNCNYTIEKYVRAERITDILDPQTYMEVFQDGSAMITRGTSKISNIGADNPKPFEITIFPSFEELISNIGDLDKIEREISDTDILKALNNGEDANGVYYDTEDGKKYIRIDGDTIPTIRDKYQASNVPEAKE